MSRPSSSEPDGRRSHADPAQEVKDEDDLCELRELQQQYAKATIEEREILRADLERAIIQALPGLLETADTRLFNGDYLKDMFDQCMQRVLARPDLAPDRKTNAMEDANDFTTFFDATKYWPPKLAAHAYEMTMLGLFTGLRVGLSPDEAEKFIKETLTKLTHGATDARRQKNESDIAARHAAIRTICAEKGWSLDERGIAEALATVIGSDPRYKDKEGRPLFPVSRRTIADDLTSLATTSSSPDKP
jgi:hypothetical protein